jgi:hypothetical protein
MHDGYTHIHTHIQPNVRNTTIPFSTFQGEVINTILSIHST